MVYELEIGILLLALLMIVIPPVMGIPGYYLAERAVVFLVAAAPCALVMSTPVAVAAGIGSAGREGILIKGGTHLENLGKIRAVAFDKTGTLTTGKPVVTDIIPLNDDLPHILRIVYTIERYSGHPLAKAIVKYAEPAGVQPYDSLERCVLPGMAVRATIYRTEYFVGKPEFFKEITLIESIGKQIELFQTESKTVMFVGTQTNVFEILAVRDEVRPDAREMIQQLHRMGISTAMLTGDNFKTARSVALDLTIDDVQADLKPEEKVHAIQSIANKEIWPCGYDRGWYK